MDLRFVLVKWCLFYKGRKIYYLVLGKVFIISMYSLVYKKSNFGWLNLV